MAAVADWAAGLVGGGDGGGGEGGGRACHRGMSAWTTQAQRR